MRNNSTIYAGVIASYFSLGSSILIGAGMVFTGDTSEIFLMFGAMALVGLGFLFTFGLISNKRQDEDEKLDSDYFLSVVKFSKENPEKFYRQYKNLISSGTIYLIILFTNILLGIIGIIAIGIKMGRSVGGFGTIGAGLVVVLFIIIKSLFIKYEPADGFVINEESFPEIFKKINFARNKTGAPKVDKVLVGHDANCGVSKNPLGYGFRSENLLYIGIYLLSLLNDEEIESILIHEYAHMYNNDTVVSNIIARRIERWSKIIDNCENKGIIVTSFLRGFGINYITKMKIFSLAISKEKEIQADKEVVKFIDRYTYGKACMKIAMLSHYFNDILLDDSFDIRTLEEPPKDFFTRIINEFLEKAIDEKDEWKNQIIKKISNKGDTHPSYKERMLEVGVTNFDFNVDFVFTNSIEITTIINDLNKMWYEAMKDEWNDYTIEYKKNMDMVNNFRNSNDNNISIEYAMAIEDLGKFSDALNVYEALLDKTPDFAPAIFRSGLIYLAKNDQKGVDLVKKAIDMNSDYIESGLGSLLTYFENNGLSDEKERLNDWAQEKIELSTKITDEIETLYPTDKFEKASLTDEQINVLKTKLMAVPSIKRVYMVSKKMQYSNKNIVVVAVSSKQKPLGRLFNGPRLLDAEEISEILESADIPYFLIGLEQNIQYLKIFKRIENSLLIGE